MSTFGDLVGSVTSALHSYTGVQESTTWLTADIDTTSTSLPVASSDQVLRGIAEIDDELIYVHAADGEGLTLAPFGRGYRGSTAATHAINTQVLYDPVWPKVEIKKAINQQVLALYPTLFATGTTELDYSAYAIGYTLPANVEQVLAVHWRLASDPLNYWEPMFNWRYDAAQRTLNLLDAGMAGATIRVSWMGRFGEFAHDADTLTSIGLPESCADVVLYGVAQRMIRFLDPSRLQLLSVENISRSQVVAPGDAGKIANQLYAMYQQRLSEERRRLLESQPPSIHFTR